LPKLRATEGAGARFELDLDVGSKSDIGRVRTNNEDACRVLRDARVFVIADGMGGEAHGELASGIAGDTVTEFCSGDSSQYSDAAGAAGRSEFSEKTNRLMSAARLANQRIYEASLKDASLRGMGATLVAAWVEGNQLSLVHVGDSRAYLLRDGALKQLTTDHTLVEEQVRSGLIKPEEAHLSKMQNVLIRALGVKSEVELDAAEIILSSGDILLLCTDGLTRMAPNAEIERVLGETRSAQARADRLVALANEHGGEDNVSVIVVQVGSSEA